MTDERGVIVVAVSRAGAATARRLRAALPGVRVVAPMRFAEPGDEGYAESVRVPVSAAFAAGEPLVLVMAAGIAVRLIAPLLRDKRRDPAVVVVDDAGRFAISLLAGHLGGANRLAERVAVALGATPVITTASEGAGVPSPDLIGREHGWRIDPASDLTRVAAALVNEEPVGLVQECATLDVLSEPLPTNLTRYPTLDALLAAAPAAALVVSTRAPLPLPEGLPAVVYRPPLLVLGVGTSRDAPAQELRELVLEALAEAGLAPQCVAAVATVELKRDEPAVTALAAELGVPLLLYSPADLDVVPGEWIRSPVVHHATGTHGVCEPAALLGSRGGTLVVSKRKSAHATVAVAQAAKEILPACSPDVAPAGAAAQERCR